MRDEATEALKGFMAGEPPRLRRLSELERAAKDPEVKARLRSILGAHGHIVHAAHVAGHSGLYRAPDYFGALLDSADEAEAAAARRRLSKLLGRDFKDASEFRAWYAKHKDRLVWDEKAGRYR